MSPSRLVRRYRVPLLLCLGGAALAWLVVTVGAAEVAVALRRVWGALPLLMAIQAACVLCDILATRLLLPGSVPLKLLVRAQLVASGLSSVVPMGRAAGEAVKATMLTSATGGSRAAAAGVSLQASTLFVNGAVGALIAVVAVRKLGVSWLTGCLLAQAVLLCGLGIALPWTARRSSLTRWAGRLWPRGRHGLEAFRSRCSESGYLPAGSTAIMMASRALRIVQVMVLCRALGVDSALSTALTVDGVHVLAVTLGDVIPAQLGVVDGILAVAGPKLGMAAATGAAAGMVLHSVQLGWAVIAAGLAFSIRGGGRTAGVERQQDRASS